MADGPTSNANGDRYAIDILTDVLRAVFRPRLESLEMADGTNDVSVITT